MSDSTAFDMYMKNLSKIRRLSNQEQRELKERSKVAPGIGKATAALEGQALLVVSFVFNRMQANDRLSTVESFDMDALQEANFAALRALPEWNPDRGTLATWLVPHIKGALLNYANTHTNGGIGSKHNKLVQVAIDEVVASEELSDGQDNPGMDTSEPITLEESLTYESEVLPNAEAETLRQQVWDYAYKIPQAAGALLTHHYVSNWSIKDIAGYYQFSEEKVRRMLREAEASLKELVNDAEVINKF